MTKIGGKIGPYHYDPATLPQQRTAGKKTYTVGIATAYNAFGLIGTELNGVFVLNETDKAVVLDQHAIGPSGGFGATTAQKAAMEKLLAMPDADFLAFIKADPRSRIV